MKNTKLFSLLLLSTGLAYTNPLQAQSGDLDLVNHYELTVSGTSTLHDWECTVEQVKADVSFKSIQKEIVGITQLRVTIPSESIKSGKKAMDNKLYDALKTRQYPEIDFKLSELLEFDPNGTVRGRGDLTIAGVTREVIVTAKSDNTSPGQVTFAGSQEISLLDYNIEPPVALFGTIRTGEKITFEFQMTLNTKANLL